MKTTLKVTVVGAILFCSACKENELPKNDSETVLTESTKDRYQSSAITETYYVDDVNGNDNHDGKSTANAWKTISKVNSITFQPGNRILFRAGGSWTNRLRPLGSGSSGSPIIIGMYGSGAKPRIKADGLTDAAIYLYNQEYIEIHDLEITNFKSSEEGNISLLQWEANNTNTYANATSPVAQYSKMNSMKYGIRIKANSKGAVDHIYLKNLNVHGVNGAISQSSENTKNNGGIFFEITGTAVPTWWNDILIEGCTIHNVDRTGLFFTSEQDDRTLTSNINWKPAQNVRIINNTFRNSGANALIVRVAQSPLMENNLFDRCAIKISGNAAFNFNTDDALWQHNEVRYTRANIGDRDAGGIDSDFRTKRTIIQYNYSHHNDFGMLVTGGGGNGSFNDGTIVRYNLFEKEGLQAHVDHGRFVLKTGGFATNTHYYNNTIYISSAQTGVEVATHTSWGGMPSNTKYTNNLVYNNGSQTTFDLGSSSYTFDYNLFAGNGGYTHKPSQAHNVVGTVLMVTPGGNNPLGYKLKTGSAGLNAGKVIPSNGGKDYFGLTVSSVSTPNVGFHNGLISN